MEDSKIIQLYWDRNQDAIPATSKKYGGYLGAIAQNILASREDAQECINDTYLRAWNSMPPHRPQVLSSFLGKITRNLSFNRYRYNHASKRGGGEIPAVLDELSELVSGRDDVGLEINRRELLRAIDTFLDGLPKNKRNLFVLRYWYADSISHLAKQFHTTENNISVSLNRLRRKLRDYLTERGFEI